MFTIGPRYSFGCPAVFTLASCGVLWCSAVFCSFQAYPSASTGSCWSSLPAVFLTVQSCARFTTIHVAMPCFFNHTQTYADKIKLRKITGRRGERGKDQLVPLLMSSRQQCLRSHAQTVGGREMCAVITYLSTRETAYRYFIRITLTDIQISKKIKILCHWCTVLVQGLTWVWYAEILPSKRESHRYLWATPCCELACEVHWKQRQAGLTGRTQAIRWHYGLLASTLLDVGMVQNTFLGDTVGTMLTLTLTLTLVLQSHFLSFRLLRLPTPMCKLDYLVLFLWIFNLHLHLPNLKCFICCLTCFMK